VLSDFMRKGSNIIRLLAVAVLAYGLPGILFPALSPRLTVFAVTNATVSATVVIPVEGISCISCASRVKRALEAIDGVAEVKVDLEHRNVRVRYVEGRVKTEQLMETINNLGFKTGSLRMEDAR